MWLLGLKTLRTFIHFFASYILFCFLFYFIYFVSIFVHFILPSYFILSWLEDRLKASCRKKGCSAPKYLHISNTFYKKWWRDTCRYATPIRINVRSVGYYKNSRTFEKMDLMRQIPRCTWHLWLRICTDFLKDVLPKGRGHPTIIRSWKYFFLLRQGCFDNHDYEFVVKVELGTHPYLLRWKFFLGGCGHTANVRYHKILFFFLLKKFRFEDRNWGCRHFVSCSRRTKIPVAIKRYPSVIA